LHSLRQLHTFGLPAYCKSFQVLQTSEEAETFAKRSCDQRFLILGEGSNCAFIDNFDGLVAQIQLRGREAKAANDAYQLVVGAGENWHQLVVWTLKNNMNGLENLALIPGTVGAAPIQNIGAYGAEVSEFIEWVEYREIGTGNLVRLSNAECKFGYRDSVFKSLLRGKALITRVCFTLPRTWCANQSYAELKLLATPSAKMIFDKVVQIRQSKLPDPDVLGNAGSFFKNPVVPISLVEQLKQSYKDIPYYELPKDMVKVPAAWLIDQAGYKGRCYGGIMCHTKQPLVLVNHDAKQTTGRQLMEFALDIQTTVEEKFHIRLVPEVQLIGQTGLINL
jgi:UDP-N-acetylmuramate dehydrogenase